MNYKTIKALEDKLDAKEAECKKLRDMLVRILTDADSCCHDTYMSEVAAGDEVVSLAVLNDARELFNLPKKD